MENSNLQETVARLFLAVDERDWEAAANIFSERVLLDYTSMAGGKPAILTPEQIIDSWKQILPGFDHTHHQVGNFITEIGLDQAIVVCYGTASHFLENPSSLNTWIVVGTYNFLLEREFDSWRITEMKFNLKYIDGNHDLPEIAQKRLKKS